MSNKKPWFPLYCSDFDADTRHWSATEIGIYLRLLMHQWQNPEGLPNNYVKLQRIARVTDHEWVDGWTQIEPKFEERDGRLFNKRLEQEREKSDRYIEQKRQAGLASGAARRKNPPEVNDIEHPFISRSNGEATKGATESNQSQSQSQSHSKSGARGTRRPPKKGAQLPEDWKPASNLLDWAAKNFPRVNTRKETAKFKDHWKSKGEVRKDWAATWRNWIRKADEFRGKTRASTFGLKDADRVCLREAKHRRHGETDGDFIDRMRMIEDGFG